ncbi:MAG TPA: hypothetical protein VD997_03605 [Phycisphaerales bacterium]|nr:hypothetical protein [Phycisphaerales bacterium]
MPRMRPLIVCALLPLLTGCASYNTPGGPANMQLFGVASKVQDAHTDPTIRPVLAKQPLANFPASIAIARVQASGYSNYTTRSYGHGAYSLVTAKDVEKQEDSDRIAKLPMVRAVNPISRLILPEQLSSDVELRRAAASLGADILAVYTFDTRYKNDDWAPPLAVITFGLFPTEKTKVATEASCVLLDVRNGYVYGSVEATSNKSRINNFWTDDEAADSARREAEREALDNLLTALESSWANVVRTHANRAAPQPAVVVDEDLNRLFPTPGTGSNAPEGTTYRTR